MAASYQVYKLITGTNTSEARKHGNHWFPLHGSCSHGTLLVLKQIHMAFHMYHGIPARGIMCLFYHSSDKTHVEEQEAYRVSTCIMCLFYHRSEKS